MPVRQRAIPHPFPTKAFGSTTTYRGWACTNCLVDENGYDVPRIIVHEDEADGLAHLNGFQLTESENHPSWSPRVKREPTPGDTGGPFFSQKRWVEGPSVPITVSGSDMSYTDPWGYIFGNFEKASVTGVPFPCNPIYLEWPPESHTSLDGLRELGATAISRCAPSSPTADLSTFLGETIKDGLPKLIGSSLRKWRGAPPSQIRKDLGSEYLNVEFGWKPFISDLRDLSHAITHADAIWQQYERDAGKVVRRRYEFPDIDESKAEKLNGPNSPYITGPDFGPLTTFDKPNMGHCVREHSIHRRQWFSGAFTYYLPTEDSEYGLIGGAGDNRRSVAEHVIKAKKVLGLSLTPDTVWNLMPWSWAIDWFSNTGDVIANWSNWAIDGQVLKYGYMMEHSIDKYTYTWVGAHPYRTNFLPPSISMVVETKKRVAASPYGFGIDWDGLTPRQLAITAALGMSRKK